MDRADQDFIDGYLDGHDLGCPEPSDNRSHSYRHSFAIGRAEKERRPSGTYAGNLAAAEIAKARDTLA